MDLGLKGKRVILTGGSRGIGRAALELFAAEGCDVAFFSRNPHQVEEARASLLRHGGEVFAEALDLDGGDHLGFLNRAADALGGCDVFIPNASASGAGKTADWDVSFRYDVKAAVDGCEALLPRLAASGQGAVVLMASTAAVETFIQPQAFNAMKAALLTWGKQASQAWGPKGVRVNMVTPGPIKFSGGNWSMIETHMPDFYKATEGQFALGRFGAPDDVARAVVFLASRAANYITGANLVVDGGFTKRVQF